MHYKEQPCIIYETDDCVVTLTLNRLPLNVLNIVMLEELKNELISAADDDCVGALILKANGKLFSAGVDIADHTPDKVGEMIPLFNEVCQLLVEFPAPTIAVINGPALGGGCELALCCDLAVMADDAKIGQPEIQLAAFAPIAALRLPALVGYRAAADMLLTGRILDAEEALRIGLVNATMPVEQILPWAMEKAGEISYMSHESQRINKQALRIGADNLKEAIQEVEELYLQKLMNTADAQEGIQAFIEKRPPVWSHK